MKRTTLVIGCVLCLCLCAVAVAPAMAKNVISPQTDKLTGDKLIERIVGQICYRAADLAYLLDMRDQRLSQYSSALREESGVDWEDLRLDRSGEPEST